jgi:hypothetical protein
VDTGERYATVAEAASAAGVSETTLAYAMRNRLKANKRLFTTELLSLCRSLKEERDDISSFHRGPVYAVAIEKEFASVAAAASYLKVSASEARTAMQQHTKIKNTHLFFGKRKDKHLFSQAIKIRGDSEKGLEQPSYFASRKAVAIFLRKTVQDVTTAIYDETPLKTKTGVYRLTAMHETSERSRPVSLQRIK